MMQSIEGNEIILYAGDENEATVSELVTCMSREKQAEFGLTGPETILNSAYDWNNPQWTYFNDQCVQEVRKRIQPGDIIGVIAGLCQKPVTDAFPDNRFVEWGVGYSGTYGQFNVYESYAWMHCLYGAASMAKGGPHNQQGRFYDTVIPNFFEDDYFPYVPTEERGDYFLFVGRLIDLKGVAIAADACREMGERLIVAGIGPNPPLYGEQVGLIGPDERADLMSHAKGLFAPTLYIGPYEAVAVEAMLCGTPVLTTDWGAFTEYVKPGLTGFRCRTLGEFIHGAKLINECKFDNKKIHDYATNLLSVNTIRWQYQTYFNRIKDLDGAGFYDMEHHHGIEMKEW
jgi:glycosyltransferase involved in cell wall biosynthesis